MVGLFSTEWNLLAERRRHMAEGRIKWYSEHKGYGFITTEDGGELFVHQSSVKDFGFFGLEKDILVTFDIKQTPKGDQAINVRPLKSS